MGSTTAIAFEYDRLADVYDERWARYVLRSTEQTMRHLPDLPPAAAERVLDIGCGTGAMLRRVREKWPDAECYGIDLSEGMLQVAARQLGDAARLLKADAVALPFAAQSFDLVVSTSSFHYWSDPTAGLREIHRVLRPRGILVVTDWCADYLACRICDVLLRITDDAHRQCYGRRYCRRSLTSAGFEIREVARYKIDWLWGLMTAVAEKSRPPA